MKAIELYFHVVLFVVDNFAKLKFKIFDSVLNLALVGVKGLRYLYSVMKGEVVSLLNSFQRSKSEDSIASSGQSGIEKMCNVYLG